MSVAVYKITPNEIREGDHNLNTHGHVDLRYPFLRAVR
jgi:hypothetical protein